VQSAVVNAHRVIIVDSRPDHGFAFFGGDRDVWRTINRETIKLKIDIAEVIKEEKWRNAVAYTHTHTHTHTLKHANILRTQERKCGLAALLDVGEVQEHSENPLATRQTELALAGVVVSLCEEAEWSWMTNQTRRQGK
jgi:hypothetical protein